jgi:hypothetical protein
MSAGGEEKVQYVFRVASLDSKERCSTAELTEVSAMASWLFSAMAEDERRRTSSALTKDAGLPKLGTRKWAAKENQTV